MIWVTWRQHRLEALIAGILLTIVVVYLLVTGTSMISMYQSSGLASCSPDQAVCGHLEGTFINHFNVSVNFITVMLSTLPLLAGMFIGAPLVARELEQRTHRLVWTQSISRARWLGTKLLLLTGVTLVAFVGLTFLTMWWSSPWNAVITPWATYDVRGIVLPAYALFALALGIAAGILARRSVAAIGITIVLFLLVRVAITFWLRPYFLPPLTFISSFEQPGAPHRSDWTIKVETIDRNGQPLSDSQVSQICPQLIGNGSAAAFTAFQTCEKNHGFQSRSTYQPVDRFWIFQAIESIIFLLLSLALLVPTTWLATRKIT